jgi:hypothetical protein
MVYAKYDFYQKIVVLIDSRVHLLFCMLPLLQLDKEELIYGLIPHHDNVLWSIV